MSQIKYSNKKSMVNLPHIRRIDIAMHFFKYFIYILLFSGIENNGKSVLAEIRRKVHFVEGL